VRNHYYLIFYLRQ